MMQAEDRLNKSTVLGLAAMALAVLVVATPQIPSIPHYSSLLSH